MMGEWIRRWRWPALVSAILLAGLAWSFWPEAARVDLGEISRGPLAIGVTDDGVTRAKDVFVVSAPITGYMSRIELEPGDKVERGTVITRMQGLPSTPLDPRTRAGLERSLASARAAEQAAVLSADQAKRDLAREEKLAKRGFVASSRLEQSRTAVARGEAAVRQARGEVQRISALLVPATGQISGKAIAVHAPATGSVLTVTSESEGVIAEGTPLVEIGNPQAIEAVVDLLSREAVRVKPGDPVEVTQWGGDRPLTGRVDRIEPFGRLKISALGIEEQRVNVIIAFDAASASQAARLGHGYQFDATIQLWRKPDALRVPVIALFRGEDRGWRVFVVDHGRARERAVKIGHIGDEFAEVLDGVSEGDKVILNPGGKLRDGSRTVGR